MDGKILHWICNFLTERLMKVRVSNHFSSIVNVTSGVPQGTCLGPVLFLIYVNHVVSQLRCSYKIFADDVKIYLEHDFASSSAESSAMLQHDINTLTSVSRSWGLTMNIDR